MTDRKPKRPHDANQLAKAIVDISTGTKPESIENKDKAKQKGGLRGGKARALSLTKEERSKIAKIAAKKRWEKS